MTFAAFGHSWIVLGVLLASLWGSLGAGVCAARDPLGPDQYNVVWNSPSAKAIDSMPIGNGDVGMAALQRMVLQCEGRQILLLPVDTTVQGAVQGGQLTKLLVEPESRRADVVMTDGWGNPGQ